MAKPPIPVTETWAASMLSSYMKVDVKDCCGSVAAELRKRGFVDYAGGRYKILSFEDGVLELERVCGPVEES